MNTINTGSPVEPLTDHAMHLSHRPSSAGHSDRSVIQLLQASPKEKDKTLNNLTKPQQDEKEPPTEKIPWSLDTKELTLYSRNIADWSLRDVRTLARYLEHPSNALESVNFWCSIWGPFAMEDVQPEVFVAILESLGRMPRLQRLSVACNGIPLSMLPTSLLRLPRLEIRCVDISFEDAVVFARALSHEEYDQKHLSFLRLDDTSSYNLFAGLKEYPLDNLQKLDALGLGSSGVKSMSAYLTHGSHPELVLRNNIWSAELFGPFVTSLTAPSNGVTKLKFHRASFPPESAQLWQRLFQEKSNLQALSFVDLVGNDENRWNEGLVRALEIITKLPASLTTLDFVHSLDPLRPPHSLAFLLPNLIERNPQIQNLNLSSNLEGLQDTTMIPIARVLANSSVERLDLSNASFTHTGLQAVIQCFPPTLNHLNLSRIQITHDSAELLGSWFSQERCSIEELIMDWCRLTPLGLDWILGALTINPQTSKLRKLSLQWCEPLGVHGWMLLTHYLPKLPESLADLSFGCFALSLKAARENTRQEDRARREKERLQSRILRNKVVEFLRVQTNLQKIRLQLDLPIGPYANYFARRNQLFQYILHSEQNDSSWVELLHHLQAAQASPSENESEASLSTSLVERAFPRSIYVSAAANATGINTYDCELSLMYDCLSQRPDWIATR